MEYYDKIKAGLCSSCGKKSQKNLTQCESCSKRTNKSVKKLREQRLLDGLCRCGNEKNENFKYCEKCLLRQRNKNSEIRKKVFDHYGGKCMCCFEAEDAFLTIDHKNNDGNVHRKKINCPNGGTPFYSWLIKNDFPLEFQILCFNCNFAKHKLGVCPHQKV